MFNIDPNFWQDVEVRDKLKFVIYGDTDSLYINLPTLDKNIPADEAWNKISGISTKINDIIANALNSAILPKLGISKEHNRTDFKTESLIVSMLLIGTKKNYAYKKIAEEGVIYDKPKITYKGIPIVRSDYSKFAQNFIKYLVDNIALNSANLTESPIDILSKFAKEQQEDLYRELNNFNFRYVATPGRWKENNTYKKETFVITGMRVYNTIFNKDIFRPGTSGFSLPINIKNKTEFLNKISKNKSDSSLFLNNTNIDNIKYIVVPHNYEPEELKTKFKDFTLELNYEETWDKSVTTITQHIVDVIKAN